MTVHAQRLRSTSRQNQATKLRRARRVGGKPCSPRGVPFCLLARGDDPRSKVVRHACGGCHVQVLLQAKVGEETRVGGAARIVHEAAHRWQGSWAGSIDEASSHRSRDDVDGELFEDEERIRERYGMKRRCRNGYLSDEMRIARWRIKERSDTSAEVGGPSW